jgi:ABC-type molybdate transport system substrate-binding protein
VRPGQQPLAGSFGVAEQVRQSCPVNLFASEQTPIVIDDPARQRVKNGYRVDFVE